MGTSCMSKIFDALLAASRAHNISISEEDRSRIAGKVLERYERSVPEKELFFTFDFPQFLDSYTGEYGIYSNILDQEDRGFLQGILSDEGVWDLSWEDMDRVAFLYLLADVVYLAKVEAHHAQTAGIHDLLMQEQVLLNSIIGRRGNEKPDLEDLIGFARVAIDPVSLRFYPELENAVLLYGKTLRVQNPGAPEVLHGAYTMHTLRSLERVVAKDLGPAPFGGRIESTNFNVFSGRVERPFVRKADSLATYEDKEDYVYFMGDQGVYQKEGVGFEGEITLVLDVPTDIAPAYSNACILRAAKSFSSVLSKKFGSSAFPKIDIHVVGSLHRTPPARSVGWHRLTNAEKGMVIDLGYDRRGKPMVRAFVTEDFLRPGGTRESQRRAIEEMISSSDMVWPNPQRIESNGPGVERDGNRRPVRVLFLDTPFAGAKAPMKIHSASLFLGTALKDRGIEMDISSLDFSALEQGDAEEAVLAWKTLRRDLAMGYDVVAFGFSADIGIGHISRLMSIISENTDALIAVGGPMPTLLPEHVLTYLPDIDILIRGEAEEAFPRLLASLALSRDLALTGQAMEDLSELKGCWVHAGNSYWVNALGHRNIIKNLDAVRIDFSLVKDKEVLSAPDGIPARILGLMFSRGCSKGCTFCAHVHTKKVRTMSADRMIETVLDCQKELYEEGIPFHLYPQDDDFFARPDLAMEFMEKYRELVDKGLVKIKIASLQMCFDSLLTRQGGRHEPNERIMDCLVRCKCIFSGGIPHLVIGTDSFTDASIRRLRKGRPRDPYTVEDIHEVLRALDQRGVKNEHFVILTDPESDDEEVAACCRNIGLLYETYRHFDLKEVIPGIIPDPATPIVKDLQSRQTNLQACLSADFMKIKDFPEFDFFERGFVVPAALEFFSFKGPHMENLLFGTDRSRFREAADLYRAEDSMRQKNNRTLENQSHGDHLQYPTKRRP